MHAWAQPWHGQPLIEPRGRVCAARYLRNITIPAAFITKSDGQKLKDLFKTGAGGAAEDVYIVMDWNDVLPRAEKVRFSWRRPPLVPEPALLRFLRGAGAARHAGGHARCQHAGSRGQRLARERDAGAGMLAGVVRMRSGHDSKHGGSAGGWMVLAWQRAADPWSGDAQSAARASLAQEGTAGWRGAASVDRQVLACVQVDWEFWTNSNDMCGAVCDVQKEFIKVCARAHAGCTAWPLPLSRLLPAAV